MGTEATDMIVRMWEVRAMGAGFDELLTWVCDEALPKIEVLPLHVASEVYSSTDRRIVVISKWRGGPVTIETPPDRLIARAPHVWDFTQVDR
jgi:hypothetical protein